MVTMMIAMVTMTLLRRQQLEGRQVKEEWQEQLMLQNLRLRESSVVWDLG